MSTTKRKPSQATLDRHEAAVAEANDNLMARLERMAADPAEWVHFIETVAAWGARYSLGNQCLLLDQCEARELDPQMFLPYGGRDGRTGWLAEGRQVRKGERAFTIWAPIKRRLSEAEAVKWEQLKGKKIKRDDQGRLPIMVVGWKFARTFELSQTDATTEAGANYVVPTVQVRRSAKVRGGKVPTVLTGDDPTGIYSDVVELIEREGYTYELVKGSRYLGSSANGVTVKGTTIAKVQVRNTLAPAQRVKTAIHELAHIRCEHLDALARVGENLHQGRKETEAESVAHIVCRAFGLDSSPYTDAYVMGWANGDMDVVREAASTVCRVAKSIVEDLAPMEPRSTETEEVAA